MDHHRSLMLVAVFGFASLVPVCCVADADTKPASKSKKARVEFRWLEAKHTRGLTSPNKVKTSCGDDFCFFHIKPILTHADVAKARMTEFHYPSIGNMYYVTFDLTQEAKKKLIKSATANGHRAIGIFIDGQNSAVWSFRPTDPQKFRPMTGFRKSKQWAVRILNACQRVDD